MWHRVLVALDVLLILIFWHAIRHPEDRLRVYPRRRLWHRGKVFLCKLDALTVSWLVLTFPGDERSDWVDPMEDWLLAIGPESLIDRGGGQPMLWPTRNIFEWLPFLERNLSCGRPIWTGVGQRRHRSASMAKIGLAEFGISLSLFDRDLRFADLSRSILVRSELRGAIFEGALLVSSNLQSVHLRRANLQGAVLRNAHLSGAILRDADLRGAGLRGVNLQGADLRGANLQGAILVV
jgi:hypothetical protein